MPAAPSTCSCKLTARQLRAADRRPGRAPARPLRGGPEGCQPEHRRASTRWCWWAAPPACPWCRSWCARMTGKEPNKGVNPDEVVAVGAAIQARRAGRRGEGCAAARRDPALAGRRDPGRRDDRADRAQHHHPGHARPRSSPPPRTTRPRWMSTSCRASARWPATT